MKIVGYFEGTDPYVLTRLVSEGYGTIPLANPYDNHGKIASRIVPGDVHLIIGYLHKLLPPVGETENLDYPTAKMGIDPPNDISPHDLLYPAKTNSIPVLVIAPSDCHDEARELLGDAADWVTFVKPADLESAALDLLKK
ncbi:MAG: hypothetical protein ACFFCP_19280 [Promethearchaeota archaeon]